MGYVEGCVAYRRYFGSEGQILTLQAGLDEKGWGIEAGASALRSRPLAETASSLSYEVHAFAWTGLGEIIASAKGIRALVQYQAFIQPQTVSHAVLGQLGYRF